MDLDLEDYEALGFHSPQPARRERGGIFESEAIRSAWALKKEIASDKYEASAKGKAKRAAYNAAHRTRPQRQKRARKLRKARETPVLRGYARIKAWREKNPSKYKKIQQKYEKSTKRKAGKKRRYDARKTQ